MPKISSPKLSVVIPAYNVRGYIAHALTTLAEQRVSVGEVILVDDGSTDGTVDAVRSAIARVPLENLKVIRQPNTGVSAARNAGLMQARGEWIFFLDGDDFVAPELTEFLSGPFDQTADVICWRFSHISAIGDDLPTFDRAWHSDIPAWSTGMETLRRVLNKEQQLWICASAYRRRFLEDHDLHFTDGCATGQDTEFVWKALSMATGVLFVDRSLSRYVNRPDSRTNTMDMRRLDAALAFQRTADFLASLPSEEAAVLAENVRGLVPYKYLAVMNALAAGTFADWRASLRLVNVQYPELTREVRQMIMLRRDQRHRTPRSWKWFSASPLTYWNYRKAAQLRRRLAAHMHWPGLNMHASAGPQSESVRAKGRLCVPANFGRRQGGWGASLRRGTRQRFCRKGRQTRARGNGRRRDG